MREAAVVTFTALLVGALSGCASGVVPKAPGAAPTPTETIEAGPRHGTEVSEPGPFVIQYGKTELRLWAHTYCTSGGCVDGFDREPASVGSSDELLVYTGLTGFRDLVATQISGDDACASRSVTSPVTDLGEGWWRVEPAGPADEYRLSLFAGGADSGDAIADLLWTVDSATALPAPEASLTVIADHEGRPDSYGVEFRITNLEKTPDAASATVTVTAANGAAHTFTAKRDSTCEGIGALNFTAPESEGKTAAALGGFPFEYRVELTLDGVTHIGSGTYPDDVERQSLGVTLVLDPPLR